MSKAGLRFIVLVVSSLSIHACCSGNLDYDPEHQCYVLREPLSIGFETNRGRLSVSYTPPDDWTYALSTIIGGNRAATTKALAVVQRSENDLYEDKFVIYGDGRGVAMAPFEFQAPITVTEIYAKGKDVRWPDYVFAPGYELRSLYELESYIRRHHHLPDLPSSEEVRRSGVPLLTTQAALVQKVEELTLYVISLQKQVDSLKALVSR